MDPRSRADDLLARAGARGAFVVTPHNMTSPMDASQTVRIPRAGLPGAGQDPESTIVIPTSQAHPAEGQAPSPGAMWPQTDQQGGEGPARGHGSVYAALTPDEQPDEWQFPRR
ncbi:hypothetical protein GIY23_18840 [Allosaccharopolyspora coralli]|uniref:Uncharacterized protein n=1 Tax=Allosaccharopolyspora coralli TaxID=2665642 RepID=A0A5Q3QDM8_9PSEU|nr:hypothetical protein [Allosaccharopolyspora coralli]QGK71304.1 hypothetical protein GIY23_18840 [Allosaccharopolyspora coralli]